MIEVSVSAEKMAAFRADGQIELNGGRQYFPNEYCPLSEETNPKRAALAKVDPAGARLLPILDCREGILVRLGLANAAEADKNVRAPFAFLHVVGNGELRPSTSLSAFRAWHPRRFCLV